MKAAALALLLASCQPAYADEPLDYAAQGQLADVATTVVGITAFDLVEANPLQAGLLVVKPLVVAWANKQPEPERTEALHTVGALGYAAAAANVATILSAPSGLSLLVGIVTGVYLFNDKAQQRAERP